MASPSEHSIPHHLSSESITWPRQVLRKNRRNQTSTGSLTLTRRIRAIFGLTSDDPLPEVHDENLRIYHRYLATHLSFPFRASYSVATGAFEENKFLVTVVGLLDVDECNDEDGLLCEATQEGGSVDLPLAEVESTINIHNRELLSDYGYWFCVSSAFAAVQKRGLEWSAARA